MSPMKYDAGQARVLARPHGWRAGISFREMQRRRMPAPTLALFFGFRNLGFLVGIKSHNPHRLSARRACVGAPVDIKVGGRGQMQQMPTLSLECCICRKRRHADI